jgi:hypothetical protein
MPGYVLLLILIQMEAIYLTGRHTGLRPIRTSNSEIISLQERDYRTEDLDFVQAFRTI